MPTNKQLNNYISVYVSRIRKNFVPDYNTKQDPNCPRDTNEKYQYIKHLLNKFKNYPLSRKDWRKQTLIQVIDYDDNSSQAYETDTETETDVDTDGETERENKDKNKNDKQEEQNRSELMEILNEYKQTKEKKEDGVKSTQVISKNDTQNAVEVSNPKSTILREEIICRSKNTPLDFIFKTPNGKHYSASVYR